MRGILKAAAEWTGRDKFALEIVGLSLVFLAVPGPGSSQTPATNDNFASRIVLTGTSITFIGDLTGATREPNEPGSGPPSDSVLYFPQTRKTLWWSWTAPDTMPVTFQIKSLVTDNFAQDGLLVWTNNYSGFPTNGQPPGNPFSGTRIDSKMAFSAFTYMATSAVIYQIQLVGTNDLSFFIQIDATNAPVILEQPRSYTVSPGGSVLFKVAAAGIPPLSYQWLFNENILPGEDKPMLAMDDVSINQAGDYSVAITSATGTTVSESALLNVSVIEPAPLLSFPHWSPIGEFAFVLQGELRRSYRVETSSNLLTWVSEKEFPLEWDIVSSVVFNTNGLIPLVIPAGGPFKFARAFRYTASNEVCINNLKQLRFAKELWAWENKQGRMSTPMPTEISPYLKNNSIPACPLHGIYRLGAMGVLPLCSIPDHLLEEPR